MQSVSPATTARPDPAPSRLKYRAHRLWLTPAFRLLLRVGVPFCVSAGLTLAYLSDQERRDNIVLAVSDMRRAIEERPEFMVKLMAIDGASASVGEDIREIVPIDFPVSSFDLNLNDIRDSIAGLDAVERAAVRIRPGGVLQVDVTERLPVVVWRSEDGLELLDGNGALVGPLDSRVLRPDLPLIAGAGADARVPEAMALLAAASPLHKRLRGLVRVGERRWNVVLDAGQTVLLPETNPVAALNRVIAMDQALDVLKRDVAAVDMRNGDRPTVRLNKNAVRELWRIRQLQVEAGDQ